LWSQQFGYIQRYSITKYHSLLIVFESIVSTARGSGASRLLAINVRASYAAVMFCCSSPPVVARIARAGGPKQI
jgi:hypothetical protein